MTSDNAVLTEIRGPALPDRSGDTDGDGELLWAGRASGYLKRERSTSSTDGDQVNTRKDVFFLLDTEGAPVLEIAGPDWEATKVTIEDRRLAVFRVRTFTVNAMEHRQGGPKTSSVRLELNQER